MKSLRARAVVGGVLSAVVIIGLAFTGLASLADEQSEQNFSDMLHHRHEMVVSMLETYRTAPRIMALGMGDPMFQRPFSGQYWQITGPDGTVMKSESLQEMQLPPAAPPEESPSERVLRMPDGQDVRTMARWIDFEDGPSWHVQVASSLVDLEEDQRLFRNNMLVAFGVITVVGVLGALLQVALILRPLNALRRDVISRWQGEDGLNQSDYPTEVVPLVIDINTLLARNREMSHRSRRQVADLAHAIKTPSAIVRNELECLLDNGQDVQNSIDALDRLDAQLNRSFARMRADGGHAEIPVIINVGVALRRILRAFEALAANAEKTLTAQISSDLRARIDRSDLDEIMGNLLDNALKWSTTRVCVTAHQDGDLIVIEVADDGQGIPDMDLAGATQSGRRLDTAKPGTGLGLAIVKDLTHAYGGSLTMGRSATKGGLCVTVTLKASRGRRSR